MADCFTIASGVEGPVAMLQDNLDAMEMLMEKYEDLTWHKTGEGAEEYISRLHYSLTNDIQNYNHIMRVLMADSVKRVLAINAITKQLYREAKEERTRSDSDKENGGGQA